MIQSLGMEFDFMINNDLVSIVVEEISRKGDILVVGGVSHKVIEVNSFVNLDVLALRKKYSTDITFFKRQGDCVFAKTFEAGGEKFTSSCGTGAIAASLSAGVSKIFMPGGLLKVEKVDRGVMLTGKVVKEGIFCYGN